MTPPKEQPTKQRSDIQRQAFWWPLVNEQPVPQAASLYRLRNSLQSRKLPTAILCFYSWLDSHQGYTLTRLQTFSVGDIALLPCGPLFCPSIITSVWRPQLNVQLHEIILSRARDSKKLHILFLYITLRKKRRIFSTWDVHIVSHVAAQNSSLPCAVWI